MVFPEIFDIFYKKKRFNVEKTGNKFSMSCFCMMNVLRRLNLVKTGKANIKNDKNCTRLSLKAFFHENAIVKSVFLCEPRYFVPISIIFINTMVVIL